MDHIEVQTEKVQMSIAIFIPLRKCDMPWNGAAKKNNQNPFLAILAVANNFWTSLFDGCWVVTKYINKNGYTVEKRWYNGKNQYVIMNYKLKTNDCVIQDDDDPIGWIVIFHTLVILTRLFELKPYNSFLTSLKRRPHFLTIIPHFYI